MTAQSDFDRRLQVWFSEEAAAAPPPEPLARALETTRRQRPRPTLVARFGSHWVGGSTGTVGPMTAGLRPALVIVLVALLVAALAWVALVVGSRLSTPPNGPLQHLYRDELVTLPDLSRPMAYPQVVPLADGRVLVIGSGGDGGDPTISAEFYDPETGSSATIGPIVTPRGFIDQALGLRDGRVLIFADGVAQILDPTTLMASPVGRMVNPSRAPAVVLQDGRVLVAGGITPGGGYKTGLLTAELFDPATLTFSATGSMAAPAWSLTTLPDGRVFVAPDDTRDPAQVYDPITGAFTAAGTMSTTVGVTTAVSLRDGRVMVFGSTGSLSRHRPHAEIWDPASLTFVVADDPQGDVVHAILLDDGRIFQSCGGRFGLSGGGRDPGWSGIYDPATGETVLLPAPGAAFPAATRLADGRVLLVGGLRDADMVLGSDGDLHDAPAVATVQVLQ